MQIITAALRCRIIQTHFLSISRGRNTSHPSLCGNHIVACVRLASTEPKSGLLSRIKNIFNRSPDETIPMSPRIRSVMDLTPRHVQPMFKESFVTFENENKDDKKGGDNNNLLTKAVGNVKGNDQAKAYKYQWGVKLQLNSSELRDDEKSSNYVITRKWGVQVPKSKETLNSPIQNETKAIPIEPAVEKPDESTGEKTQNIPAPQASETAPEKLTSSVTTVQSLDPETLTSSEKEVEKPSIDIKLTVTPAAILTSDASLDGDDDYNIPKEMPYNGEILAWQDVVTRSKLHEDELARRIPTASEIQIDSIGTVFIRPEPPERRVDVEIVKSASKVGLSDANVVKTSDLSTNIVGINFTETKKLHTCGIVANGHQKFARNCHYWTQAKYFSTTSRYRKETLPPEEKNSMKTPTTDENDVQAATKISVKSKVEENLDDVLQELPEHEMEVLQTYEQQSSEENGTLSTSEQMKTIPHESSKDTLGLAKSDDDENLNKSSTRIMQMEESEATILNFKESNDKDEDKEIEDKKSIKDGDYVRVPGDPYPYSREHYEKWRLPHGKCPIVNDDVPKVKPVETNDSPRNVGLNYFKSFFRSYVLDNKSSPIQNKTIPKKSKNSSDRENKHKSLTWLREVAVGAEQPTNRVQTIHPDIQPPKRDVVENSLSKDQASKLVQNPQSIDVKASSLIVSKEVSQNPATLKQIHQKAINNEVEAQRIYEMKNYAYITPENSKNPHELLIKRVKKN